MAILVLLNNLYLGEYLLKNVSLNDEEATKSWVLIVDRVAAMMPQSDRPTKKGLNIFCATSRMLYQ